jgi:hypothetical protein
MFSDFIIQVATVFGVSFGGTLLSLIGCSQIYKAMKRKYKKDDLYYKHKTLDEYYKDYEQRYVLTSGAVDVSNVAEEDEVDVKYENRFVHESTPDGSLIMKYDSDDKLFVYWSDQNIKHRYLITVARKFCKVYCCEHLYYLDTNKLYDKDEKKNDDTDDEDEGEEDGQNDFLFLKKENSTNTKTDTNVDEDKQIKTSIRFRKVGPIRDFEILKKSKISKLLKYSDFKIM